MRERESESESGGMREGSDCSVRVGARGPPQPAPALTLTQGSAPASPTVSCSSWTRGKHSFNRTESSWSFTRAMALEVLSLKLMVSSMMSCARKKAFLM